ncbi:MAG TPA: PP0621 family protein [Thiobacillaceae bacterium]|nr:PP0621 family protein [Thiobacillaceae bacterium]HNU64419.1 PP0621 family protein [Thiobacillaceae bacterium]
MAKLLLIILAVVVLVLWFKHMGRQRGEAGRPPAPKAAEDMVRCRVCAVNLPRSEAILSKGRFYCCDEHRRRDG